MTGFRAGVIGLGIVSDRIIRQFQSQGDIAVTAVCDVAEDRVKAYVDTHSGVAGFTDYAAMLNGAELDLVYVATPPSLHSEIVCAALERGLHVLCEKPLANSMAEAERMLEVARASGRVHALHFPLQYSPEMQTFEQMYKAQFLGDLRRVEVVTQFPEWPRPWQQNAWVGGRKQGGYTLEVGVHFIQSIQRVFGPINDVVAHMTWPDDEQACEIGVLAMGTLTGVHAQYPVQVLFNGLSDAGGQERVELNAYGTEGTLSLHNWGTLLAGKRGETPQVVQSREAGKSAAAPLSLVDNLVHAMQGKPAVLCDFQIGYDAQQVLEALRG